jgi:hypothetical protein
LKRYSSQHEPLMNGLRASRLQRNGPSGGP